MNRRRVYLGHIDIGPQGCLELLTSHGEATASDIVRYLFMYGLVADEVFMQGSAPLKSQRVHSAFRKLYDAFTRNEWHEPSPIYAFVLSEECEGYTDYLDQRLDFLKAEGDDNPELTAYDVARAEETVLKLDRDLSLIDVPRRTRSVSKVLRSNLIATLQAGEVDSLKDGTAQRTLKCINEKATIQTFSLIDQLHLSDAEQLRAVYNIVRDTYRRANAYGSDAIDSDSCVQFYPANLLRFFNAVGLTKFMDEPELITTEVLFKLRLSESMSQLNLEFFKLQSQQDLDEFFSVLERFRVDGKVRTMWKESPAAGVAMIFEFIHQSEIIHRALSKGLEQVVKVFVRDSFDDVFVQRYHRIFLAVDVLKKEIDRILRSS